MIQILDPYTDTTIQYHMDTKLIKKWDTLRKGKLQSINEDRIYIVDGREGSGKSSFAFQQAKYLNPNFSLDDICFKPEEFLNRIRYAPKGSVVVFDEAFRGLSSKSSRSNVNKAIVQAMMESRQRNLVIFIVLPTIFLLELYAAVLRSEALFHISKIKGEKYTARQFKIYNYVKKKQLYLRGKTKYFSYSRPKIRRAKGRFLLKKAGEGKPWVPYETFPMEAYLHKKYEAFKGSEEQEEENKWMIQRNLIIKSLYKRVIKSHAKLSAWLEEAGVALSPAMIGYILGDDAKSRKTPSPNHPIYKGDMTISQRDKNDGYTELDIT